MKSIFDRNGAPIAWLEGQFAFSLSGKQLNLYRDFESILTLQGKYLGYFSNGFFRDQEGYPVAFVKGAHVGPELPVLQVPPLPPALEIPVFPMLPVLPPYPAVAQLTWSKLSWVDYLRQ
jgi:hypothetical protein